MGALVVWGKVSSSSPLQRNRFSSAVSENLGFPPRYSPLMLSLSLRGGRGWSRLSPAVSERGVSGSGGGGGPCDEGDAGGVVDEDALGLHPVVQQPLRLQDRRPRLELDHLRAGPTWGGGGGMVWVCGR